MDLIRRLRAPKKEENGTESPSDHSKLSVDVNFVGTDGCGKTTLLMAGVLGQLPEHRSPPATLTWECYSGWLPGPLYNVHFNIWDTPGADGTDRIRAIGYKHNVSKSDIAVILFNIGGSSEDIENLDMEILPEVDDYCPGAAKLLVGCRLDLRKSPTRFDSHRTPPVTLQDGINAAKRIGAWGYVECSGKTNDGISELLVVLAQMAVVIKTHAKWKLSKPSMPFFVVSPDAAAPVPNPFEAWHGHRKVYNSTRSQSSVVINDAKRPNNLVSEGLLKRND
ncbi:hypothetical protein FRC09_011207 [Ceratobasidium sp. 395]|nr:hypothetical protein FRC09_011207 [Ceratobasidium sp. 395]